MAYPRLEVSLKKIKHNTERLVDICKRHNIQISGVTKMVCAIPQIAEAMVEGGVAYLADSRLENLRRLESIKIPKILLRLPMISQAKEVVELADISLNSEMETIKALSREAKALDKLHKVILMIDLGDLREGIFDEEEIFKAVSEIIELEGIALFGIGTNLTCYGGVIPRQENLTRLVTIGKEIEERFKIHLEIISGGNSSTLHLLEKEETPEEINHLRLGESIVLGRETAFGSAINDTYDDAFKLITEIIEIKEKPSIPVGEIGMNAFGKKPTFIDKGFRRRAICAIGKQDVNLEDLEPYDDTIMILGGSSDHLILDITDSKNPYKVGDTVAFNLNYGGILSSMTSEYVEKKMV